MVRRRSGRSFFSWINGLRDGRGQGCGRVTFSPITQRKGEAREVIVDLLQFCLFKTDEFVGAPDNADLCWKIFIFAKFSKRKSSHLKSLVAPFFFSKHVLQHCVRLTNDDDNINNDIETLLTFAQWKGNCHFGLWSSQ